MTAHIQPVTAGATVPENRVAIKWPPAASSAAFLAK
jgi:hypothetical protein